MQNSFSNKTHHKIYIVSGTIVSTFYLQNLTAKNLCEHTEKEVKLLLHNFSFKNNKIVLIAHCMIFFLRQNQKVSKLFTFSAQINISYNNE